MKNIQDSFFFTYQKFSLTGREDNFRVFRKKLDVVLLRKTFSDTPEQTNIAKTSPLNALRGSCMNPQVAIQVNDITEFNIYPKDLIDYEDHKIYIYLYFLPYALPGLYR